jgi:hypothetical protein
MLFASIFFATGLTLNAGDPPRPAANFHTGPLRQSLWVYPDETNGANPLSDAGALALLINSAGASGVTDLYVSVHSGTPNSAGRYLYPENEIAGLITQARANRMRVWASSGDSDWPTLGCSATAAPLMRMADLIAYNAANPTARFDGVVLDIEPQDPQTNVQYQQLLTVYECLRDSLPAGAGNRMDLAVAIRFDWTQEVDFPAGGAVEKVYEHVVDMGLANVIVMGYRNTAGTNCSGSETNGIICLDEDVITYAGSLVDSGLVLAGVETDNCVPGCGPSEVTFYSSPNGQADLNQQASVVAGYFSSSRGFGGFSVYRYQGEYLSGGLPAWPAVNNGFPTRRHLATGGVATQ